MTTNSCCYRWTKPFLQLYKNTFTDCSFGSNALWLEHAEKPLWLLCLKLRGHPAGRYGMWVFCDLRGSSSGWRTSYNSVIGGGKRKKWRWGTHSCPSPPYTAPLSLSVLWRLGSTEKLHLGRGNVNVSSMGDINHCIFALKNHKSQGS